MSLFRSLLAAAAIAAVAMPAFADDTTTTTISGSTDTTMQQTTTTTKIDLNKATVKELTNVKGINASRAKAIVSYRKKHGDFKSTDELTSVKGFKNLKPEQLKDIQDQISID